MFKKTLNFKRFYTYIRFVYENVYVKYLTAVNVYENVFA